MKGPRSIGTLGVFSLGAGAMISSGLFILPSLAFSEAGVGVLVSYALAGLAMVPAVVTRLELTSAIPKAGGAYYSLTRILGAPAGLVAGLADWLGIALKSAFALLGIGVFGALLFPSFGEIQFKIIALCACALFTFVNLASVKSTGRFQIVMVAGLLAVLVAYVLIGYRHMEFSPFAAGGPLELLPIVTTTGMVFVSYGGITKIAAAIEEVKDPRRMLVPGLLGAFLVVQVLYLLVVFVTIGSLDAPTLAASYTPLTEAAGRFYAAPAARTAAIAVVAAAGLLSFFTTANAGILAASRVPFAMSKDGLLPRFLGVLSRRGTPAAPILVTSAFMAAIVVGLDVKALAKVASLFLMLVFFLESIGLIIIRTSRLANYRPTFRAPLFPVPQVLGALVYATLIVAQGKLPLLIAGAFCAAAVLWYLVYARRRYGRTSALLTMIRRLSAPEYGSEGTELEEELLAVVMEREDIREDRFDELVRSAPVLDYDRTIERAELFADVSRLLAPRWGLEPEAVRQRFESREAQSSTVIWPGVAVPHAIPHAVVEGNSIFGLALVRARFGIRWSDDQVVYSAFCLIGSMDERNFHLRALMSIAQTLQDPGFLHAWAEARNARELRSSVLLTARKRGHLPEPG